MTNGQQLELLRRIAKWESELDAINARHEKRMSDIDRLETNMFLLALLPLFTIFGVIVWRLVK